VVKRYVDDAMCCDDGEGDGDDEDGEDVSEDSDTEDQDMVDDSAEAGETVAVNDADPNVAAIREAVEEYSLDTLFPPLDGTAFYSIICHINHSCEPNVRVTYINCPQRGLLARLVVLKPIAPGEELVQSYIDQFQSLAERRKALKDYGFACSCPKCTSEAQTM
jgi:hypothetical protein